jgi:predicted lipoprotein with Yx(FWY)xxD motif
MGHHRTAIAIFSGALALSAASALVETSGGAEASTRAATLHAAKATVDGRSETILVDAGGLPLYYYQRDTTKRSLVTGWLAVLWPPLLSPSPTESGAQGELTVLDDSNGHQVAYNGHFLYTFADDTAGHVRGQGVESFFVATPRLKPVVALSKAGVTGTASGGGYGY